MQVTNYITVGSAGVGEIEVDPTTVRGCGGTLQPHLVVPIKVRLNARPQAQQVAVLSLDCELAAGRPSSGQPRLPARLDLRRAFPARSAPWGTSPHQFDLQFPLTGPLVEHLERERHTTGGSLELTISTRAVVAWLRTYNEVPPNDHTGSAPFEPRLGMLADATMFWTTTVGDLVFAVDSGTWADRVLPGVGHDTIRLVEVRLPPELNDPTARSAFAKQLRHLDRLGYSESISASRSLLKAWEQRLGASKANTVADIVAAHKSWPLADSRRRLLDATWVALKDFANAAHHEENLPAPIDLAEAEARAHLLMVAAVSEWLSTALGVP